MRLDIPTAPSSGTNISQTEIDFGTTPVSEESFTVIDVTVSASSQIIAQIAYEAPTGKDLDEIEMDDIQLRCQPDVGLFTIYARAADGSYLADKFKVNYLVG